MNSKKADRQSIKRLFEIRNRFDSTSSEEKLTLIRSLDKVTARSCVELQPELWDCGFVSSKEWIDLVVSRTDGTDFDWLFAQLRDKRLAQIWTQLYEAADVPLRWDLSGIALSKTQSLVPAIKIWPRRSLVR